MKQKLIYSLATLSLLTCTPRLTASNADYWQAADYYENSSSQKDAATDLMQYVPIAGNEMILDVGCGDGKLTAAIATRLPQGAIFGIDNSPSMIAFAKQNFPRSGHNNLDFNIQDAQQLNFSALFDVIFSFTTLQWVQSHDAFLEGAYRSLKNRGTLAITMPMGLPTTLEQAVNELVASPDWADYFKEFSTGWNFVEQQEYGNKLAAHHFVAKRLEVVPQKDIFPSRVIFEKFISQWFPYLRPLPQEKKQQFMQATIDRFLELEPPFPNGEVHFKIRRLEVVANKV